MDTVGTLQQKAGSASRPVRCLHCCFIWSCPTSTALPAATRCLVRMPQMIRAGLWLNLTGIVLIFALTYMVFGPVLQAIRGS